MMERGVGSSSKNAVAAVFSASLRILPCSGGCSCPCRLRPQWGAAGGSSPGGAVGLLCRIRWPGTLSAGVSGDCHGRGWECGGEGTIFFLPKKGDPESLLEQ